MRKSSRQRGGAVAIIALSYFCGACDRGGDRNPGVSPAAPVASTEEPVAAEPAAVSNGESLPSDSGEQGSPPPTLVTTGPVITLEQFNSLETEMPYSRVVEILGWKGVESDREDFGGVIAYKVEWMNPDGSKVNAIFRDDKLYSREQTDLKTVEQLAAEVSSPLPPAEEISAEANDDGGAAPP